ncbi:MAG: hypothetical protein JW718_05300 [Desulfovibrionaceae bacterium]|nr:hypothetical protein [Desulfovibrionaceae bacterium]
MRTTIYSAILILIVIFFVAVAGPLGKKIGDIPDPGLKVEAPAHAAHGPAHGPAHGH